MATSEDCEGCAVMRPMKVRRRAPDGRFCVSWLRGAAPGVSFTICRFVNAISLAQALKQL